MNSSLNKTMRWLYLAMMTLIAFTGFGQMPIFKRYYLSDVPGLGWSADFYTTINLHYLGSILLLAVLVYLAVNYLASSSRRRLSSSGWIRLGLLSAILFSGVFMLLKNQPGSVFSQNLIIVMNLAHLVSTMAFLFYSLYCVIRKKNWLEV